MSGTPVSVIEEEDEDVTTASASLTSEVTRTSLQTALAKDPVRGQEKPMMVKEMVKYLLEQVVQSVQIRIQH